MVLLPCELNQPQAVELLCHEYAHALAMNLTLDRLSQMPRIVPADFGRPSDDEAWGRASSRVWQAYLDAVREEA